MIPQQDRHFETSIYHGKGLFERSRSRHRVLSTMNEDSSRKYFQPFSEVIIIYRGHNFDDVQRAPPRTGIPRVMSPAEEW